MAETPQVRRRKMSGFKFKQRFACRQLHTYRYLYRDQLVISYEQLTKCWVSQTKYSSSVL